MAPRDNAGPILNGLPTNLPDIDAEETAEWLDSLDGMIDEQGRNRARYIMLKLLERSRERHLGVPSLTATDYVNTIPAEAEPWYPGDKDLERQFRRLLRWNSAVMVHRAQRPGVGVGGLCGIDRSHIAIHHHLLPLGRPHQRARRSGRTCDLLGLV